MKMRSVVHNNRRKAFEIKTFSKTFVLPYAKVDPRPTPADKVRHVFVDPEDRKSACRERVCQYV